MDWKEFLKQEMEGAYHATEGLVDLLDEKELDWKPQTGGNWMTVRQLLRHITESCGFCCRGFVTGNWGPPGGGGEGDGDMLPSAEKMPVVATLDEAKRLLSEDRALALKMLEQSSEEDLGGKMCLAPWDPEHPSPLGQHMVHMVAHLAQHKAQLFYYLKLMGKPVHTGHLYGM